MAYMSGALISRWLQSRPLTSRQDTRVDAVEKARQRSPLWPEVPPIDGAKEMGFNCHYFNGFHTRPNPIYTHQAKKRQAMMQLPLLSVPMESQGRGPRVRTEKRKKRWTCPLSVSRPHPSIRTSTQHELVLYKFSNWNQLLRPVNHVSQACYPQVVVNKRSYRD